MNTFDHTFILCIFVILISLYLQSCSLSSVPFDTAEKILTGGMIAGQAFDGATTIQKVGDGNCVEGNPVLGENPSSWTIIATKVLFSGLVLWVVNATDNHTARKVALSVGMVIGAGAGAYNSTLDCH